MCASVCLSFGKWSCTLDYVSAGLPAARSLAKFDLSGYRRCRGATRQREEEQEEEGESSEE